jgi:hypothetical protein
LLVLTAVTAYGQNDTTNTKYLSIGTKSYGICFGNSIKYNGIRLNLWDKGYGIGTSSGKINGMNFSFKISNYLSNGIEIGIIGVCSEKVINGIQIGGLVAISKNANGLAFAGLRVNANKINGAAIGGFGITADTLNGAFFGFGVAANDPRFPKKIINGLAMGVVAVGAEKVKGVTICAMWCYSKEHNGLSIAFYNKTDNLHGLQIGLLNYASNNPKLLRWLPLINFHP